MAYRAKWRAGTAAPPRCRPANQFAATPGGASALGAMSSSSAASASANAGSPVLGTRNVCQIAIVVRDVEKTARAFAEFLGVAVPPIKMTEPGRKVGMTFRGEPSDAQCKLAFFDLENTVLELIQPLGGHSSWQEVLDQKGEGVHHIAFRVNDTAGKVRTLAAEGASLFHQGLFRPGIKPEEGQYTYVDTREKLGVLIEMLEHT